MLGVIYPLSALVALFVHLGIREVLPRYVGSQLAYRRGVHGLPPSPSDAERVQERVVAASAEAALWTVPTTIGYRFATLVTLLLDNLSVVFLVAFLSVGCVALLDGGPEVTNAAEWAYERTHAYVFRPFVIIPLRGLALAYSAGVGLFNALIAAIRAVLALGGATAERCGEEVGRELLGGARDFAFHTVDALVDWSEDPMRRAIELPLAMAGLQRMLWALREGLICPCEANRRMIESALAPLNYYAPEGAVLQSEWRSLEWTSEYMVNNPYIPCEDGHEDTDGCYTEVKVSPEQGYDTRNADGEYIRRVYRESRGGFVKFVPHSVPPWCYGTNALSVTVSVPGGTADFSTAADNPADPRYPAFLESELDSTPNETSYLYRGGYSDTSATHACEYCVRDSLDDELPCLPYAFQAPLAASAIFNAPLALVRAVFGFFGHRTEADVSAEAYAATFASAEDRVAGPSGRYAVCIEQSRYVRWAAGVLCRAHYGGRAYVEDPVNALVDAAGWTAEALDDWLASAIESVERLLGVPCEDRLGADRPVEVDNAGHLECFVRPTKPFAAAAHALAAPAYVLRSVLRLTIFADVVRDEEFERFYASDCDDQDAPHTSQTEHDPTSKYCERYGRTTKGTSPLDRAEGFVHELLETPNTFPCEGVDAYYNLSAEGFGGRFSVTGDATGPFANTVFCRRNSAFDALDLAVGETSEIIGAVGLRDVAHVAAASGRLAVGVGRWFYRVVAVLSIGPWKPPPRQNVDEAEPDAPRPQPPSVCKVPYAELEAQAGRRERMYGAAAWARYGCQLNEDIAPAVDEDYGEMTGTWYGFDKSTNRYDDSKNTTACAMSFVYGPYGGEGARKRALWPVAQGRPCESGAERCTLVGGELQAHAGVYGKLYPGYPGTAFDFSLAGQEDCLCDPVMRQKPRVADIYRCPSAEYEVAEDGGHGKWESASTPAGASGDEATRNANVKWAVSNEGLTTNAPICRALHVPTPAEGQPFERSYDWRQVQNCILNEENDEDGLYVPGDPRDCFLRAVTSIEDDDERANATFVIHDPAAYFAFPAEVLVGTGKWTALTYQAFGSPFGDIAQVGGRNGMHQPSCSCSGEKYIPPVRVQELHTCAPAPVQRPARENTGPSPPPPPPPPSETTPKPRCRAHAGDSAPELGGYAERVNQRTPEDCLCGDLQTTPHMAEDGRYFCVYECQGRLTAGDKCLCAPAALAQQLGDDCDANFYTFNRNGRVEGEAKVSAHFLFLNELTSIDTTTDPNTQKVLMPEGAFQFYMNSPSTEATEYRANAHLRSLNAWDVRKFDGIVPNVDVAGSCAYAIGTVADPSPTPNTTDGCLMSRNSIVAADLDDVTQLHDAIAGHFHARFGGLYGHSLFSFLTTCGVSGEKKKDDYASFAKVKVFGDDSFKGAEERAMYSTAYRWQYWLYFATHTDDGLTGTTTDGAWADQHLASYAGLSIPFASFSRAQAVVEAKDTGKRTSYYGGTKTLDEFPEGTIYVRPGCVAPSKITNSKDAQSIPGGKLIVIKCKTEGYNKNDVGVDSLDDDIWQAVVGGTLRAPLAPSPVSKAHAIAAHPEGVPFVDADGSANGARKLWFAYRAACYDRSTGCTGERFDVGVHAVPVLAVGWSSDHRSRRTEGEDQEAYWMVPSPVLHLKTQNCTSLAFWRCVMQDPGDGNAPDAHTCPTEWTAIELSISKLSSNNGETAYGEGSARAYFSAADVAIPQEGGTLTLVDPNPYNARGTVDNCASVYARRRLIPEMAESTTALVSRDLYSYKTGGIGEVTKHTINDVYSSSGALEVTAHVAAPLTPTTPNDRSMIGGFTSIWREVLALQDSTLGYDLGFFDQAFRVWFNGKDGKLACTRVAGISKPPTALSTSDSKPVLGLCTALPDWSDQGFHKCAWPFGHDLKSSGSKVWDESGWVDFGTDHSLWIDVARGWQKYAGVLTTRLAMSTTHVGFALSRLSRASEGANDNRVVIPPSDGPSCAGVVSRTDHVDSFSTLADEPALVDDERKTLGESLELFAPRDAWIVLASYRPPEDGAPKRPRMSFYETGVEVHTSYQLATELGDEEHFAKWCEELCVSMNGAVGVGTRAQTAGLIQSDSFYDSEDDLSDDPVARSAFFERDGASVLDRYAVRLAPCVSFSLAFDTSGTEKPGDQDTTSEFGALLAEGSPYVYLREHQKYYSRLTCALASEPVPIRDAPGLARWRQPRAINAGTRVPGETAVAFTDESFSLVRSARAFNRRGWEQSAFGERYNSANVLSGTFPVPLPGAFAYAVPPPSVRAECVCPSVSLAGALPSPFLEALAGVHACSDIPAQRTPSEEVPPDPYDNFLPAKPLARGDELCKLTNDLYSDVTAMREECSRLEGCEVSGSECVASNSSPTTGGVRRALLGVDRSHQNSAVALHALQASEFPFYSADHERGRCAAIDAAIEDAGEASLATSGLRASRAALGPSLVSPADRNAAACGRSCNAGQEACACGASGEPYAAAAFLRPDLSDTLRFEKRSLCEGGPVALVVELVQVLSDESVAAREREPQPTIVVWTENATFSIDAPGLDLRVGLSPGGIFDAPAGGPPGSPDGRRAALSDSELRPAAFLRSARRIGEDVVLSCEQNVATFMTEHDGAHATRPHDFLRACLAPGVGGSTRAVSNNSWVIGYRSDGQPCKLLNEDASTLAACQPGGGVDEALCVGKYLFADDQVCEYAAVASPDERSPFVFSYYEANTPGSGGELHVYVGDQDASPEYAGPQQRAGTPLQAVTASVESASLIEGDTRGATGCILAASPDGGPRRFCCEVADDAATPVGGRLEKWKSDGVYLGSVEDERFCAEDVVYDAEGTATILSNAVSKLVPNQITRVLMSENIGCALNAAGDLACWGSDAHDVLTSEPRVVLANVSDFVTESRIGRAALQTDLSVEVRLQNGSYIDYSPSDSMLDGCADVPEDSKHIVFTRVSDEYFACVTCGPLVFCRGSNETLSVSGDGGDLDDDWNLRVNLTSDVLSMDLHVSDALVSNDENCTDFHQAAVVCVSLRSGTAHCWGTAALLPMAAAPDFGFGEISLASADSIGYTSVAYAHAEWMSTGCSDTKVPTRVEWLVLEGGQLRVMSRSADGTLRVETVVSALGSAHVGNVTALTPSYDTGTSRRTATFVTDAGEAGTVATDPLINMEWRSAVVPHLSEVEVFASYTRNFKTPYTSALPSSWISLSVASFVVTSDGAASCKGAYTTCGLPLNVNSDDSHIYESFEPVRLPFVKTMSSLQSVHTYNEVSDEWVGVSHSSPAVAVDLLSYVTASSTSGVCLSDRVTGDSICYDAASLRAADTQAALLRNAAGLPVITLLDRLSGEYLALKSNGTDLTLSDHLVAPAVGRGRWSTLAPSGPHGRSWALVGDGALAPHGGVGDVSGDQVTPALWTGVHAARAWMVADTLAVIAGRGTSGGGRLVFVSLAGSAAEVVAESSWDGVGAGASAALVGDSAFVSEARGGPLLRVAVPANVISDDVSVTEVTSSEWETSYHIPLEEAHHGYELHHPAFLLAVANTLREYERNVYDRFSALARASRYASRKSFSANSIYESMQLVNEGIAATLNLTAYVLESVLAERRFVNETRVLSQVNRVFHRAELLAQALPDVIDFFLNPGLAQQSGQPGYACARRRVANHALTGALKTHWHATRFCGARGSICDKTTADGGCPTYRCAFEDTSRCAAFEPDTSFSTSLPCEVSALLRSYLSEFGPMEHAFTNRVIEHVVAALNCLLAAFHQSDASVGRAACESFKLDSLYPSDEVDLFACQVYELGVRSASVATSALAPAFSALYAAIGYDPHGEARGFPLCAGHGPAECASLGRGAVEQGSPFFYDRSTKNFSDTETESVLQVSPCDRAGGCFCAWFGDEQAPPNRGEGACGSVCALAAPLEDAASLERHSLCGKDAKEVADLVADADGIVGRVANSAGFDSCFVLHGTCVAKHHSVQKYPLEAATMSLLSVWTSAPMWGIYVANMTVADTLGALIGGGARTSGGPLSRFADFLEGIEEQPIRAYFFDLNAELFLGRDTLVALLNLGRSFVSIAAPGGELKAYDKAQGLLVGSNGLISLLERMARSLEDAVLQLVGDSFRFVATLFAGIGGQISGPELVSSLLKVLEDYVHILFELVSRMFIESPLGVVVRKTIEGLCDVVKAIMSVVDGVVDGICSVLEAHWVPIPHFGWHRWHPTFSIKKESIGDLLGHGATSFCERARPKASCPFGDLSDAPPFRPDEPSTCVAKLSDGLAPEDLFAAARIVAGEGGLPGATEPQPGCFWCWAASPLDCATPFATSDLFDATDTVSLCAPIEEEAACNSKTHADQRACDWIPDFGIRGDKGYCFGRRTPASEYWAQPCACAMCTEGHFCNDATGFCQCGSSPNEVLGLACGQDDPAVPINGPPLSTTASCGSCPVGGAAALAPGGESRDALCFARQAWRCESPGQSLSQCLDNLELEGPFLCREICDGSASNYANALTLTGTHGLPSGFNGRTWSETACVCDVGIENVLVSLGDSCQADLQRSTETWGTIEPRTLPVKCSFEVSSNKRKRSLLEDMTVSFVANNASAIIGPTLDVLRELGGDACASHGDCATLACGGWAFGPQPCESCPKEPFSRGPARRCARGRCECGAPHPDASRTLSAPGKRRPKDDATLRHPELWTGDTRCDRLLRAHGLDDTARELEKIEMERCVALRAGGIALARVVGAPTLPEDLLYNFPRAASLAVDLTRGLYAAFTLSNDSEVANFLAREGIDPYPVELVADLLRRILADVDLGAAGTAAYIAALDVAAKRSPEAAEALIAVGSTAQRVASAAGTVALEAGAVGGETFFALFGAGRALAEGAKNVQMQGPYETARFLAEVYHESEEDVTLPQIVSLEAEELPVLTERFGRRLAGIASYVRDCDVLNDLLGGVRAGARVARTHYQRGGGFERDACAFVKEVGGVTWKECDEALVRQQRSLNQDEVVWTALKSVSGLLGKTTHVEVVRKRAHAANATLHGVIARAADQATGAVGRVRQWIHSATSCDIQHVNSLGQKVAPAVNPNETFAARNVGDFVLVRPLNEKKVCFHSGSALVCEGGRVIEDWRVPPFAAKNAGRQNRLIVDGKRACVPELETPKVCARDARSGATACLTYEEDENGPYFALRGKERSAITGEGVPPEARYDMTSGYANYDGSPQWDFFRTEWPNVVLCAFRKDTTHACDASKDVLDNQRWKGVGMPLLETLTEPCETVRMGETWYEASAQAAFAEIRLPEESDVNALLEFGGCPSNFQGAVQRWTEECDAEALAERSDAHERPPLLPTFAVVYTVGHIAGEALYKASGIRGLRMGRLNTGLAFTFAAHQAYGYKLTCFPQLPAQAAGDLADQFVHYVLPPRLEFLAQKEDCQTGVQHMQDASDVLAYLYVAYEARSAQGSPLRARVAKVLLGADRIRRYGEKGSACAQSTNKGACLKEQYACFQTRAPTLIPAALLSSFAVLALATLASALGSAALAWSRAMADARLMLEMRLARWESQERS